MTESPVRLVKCHNCGYERQQDDDRHGIISANECPKCRVIYDKVEKKADNEAKDDFKKKSEDLTERNKNNQLKVASFDYVIYACIIILAIYAVVSIYDKKTDKAALPPEGTIHSVIKPVPPAEIANNQRVPVDAGKFDEKAPLSSSLNASPQSNQQSITDIVRNIKPSVVLIQTSRGIGTGFFINHSGDVLTNHHVVVGANNVKIKTTDGNVYFVKAVISEDKANDLALLSVSIPPGEAKPLTVTSRYPEAGEKIIVVGNPAGLEQTVSDGIVSAIRGDRYIQITAPISRGSSGGPVINMNGEVVCVVGLTTTDVDPRRGNIAQNLNFCIPGEKVAGLRPGVNYPLDKMDPSRKVYCYEEDNGSVVITDMPQKVTSYTLISRPDGTLDRAEYEKWVLMRMSIEGNPAYFDPIAAAQHSIDIDREELFRRTFPHKSSSAGMTLNEQQFWNNRINQLYEERHRRAVAWKNKAMIRYGYMMNVFDRYNASSR
jgi:hypothetical protein